ncbi:MAG: prepilin-type N-terminal cleavage/methylation domain-containing protein [Phycisphaerae bacterium]|nr:prepilin-type N-terminal cleavage/methylation domain-containing protein [Phycisphaerae bacterium]
MNASPHGFTGRTTHHRGFTLIEVLVVVAIIALLLSILLPSLGNARGQAKRVVCMANLHNIYNAILMYKDSNSDRIPEWTAVGNWYFRRPPGMKDPDDPRSLPETYGLNALLAGVRPAERGEIRDRRLYLSAYSDIWRCPGAHPQMWERYRNTYAWLKVTIAAGEEVGNIPTNIYTQLLLKGKRYASGKVWNASKMPIVQDNTSFGPGACGFRGAASWSNSYRLPEAIAKAYPHAYGGRKGSDATVILWLDGNAGRPGGKAGL